MGEHEDELERLRRDNQLLREELEFLRIKVAATSPHQLQHFSQVTSLFGDLERRLGNLVRPGCPSSIEQARDCKTTTMKDNWAAAMECREATAEAGRPIAVVDRVDAMQLEAGTIPSDLVQRLAVAGRPLPEDAAVKVEVPQRAWTVSGAGMAFRVVRVQDELWILEKQPPLVGDT
jgi:hypothetical protein